MTDRDAGRAARRLDTGGKLGLCSGGLHAFADARLHDHAETGKGSSTGCR